MTATLSLQGRVALVTGAAQGLGRAEAIALAERGASVLLVDVGDLSATEAEIKHAGQTALAVRSDVTASDAGETLVSQALEAFGELDIVVNNAGIVRDGMSFSLDLQDWLDVLSVNLTATFLISRAATRYWRGGWKSGSKRERSIVNTTSESGLYGNIGQANYAAAKAGVAALTLTMAGELLRYGIRVNAIAPRARTPMSVKAFQNLQPSSGEDPFAPEHTARIVAWLVSPAAGDATGQILVTHGRAVQNMIGWSMEHQIAATDIQTDDDLLELAGQLFGEQRQKIPRPIADLFA